MKPKSRTRYILLYGILIGITALFLTTKAVQAETRVKGANQFPILQPPEPPLQQYWGINNINYVVPGLDPETFDILDEERYTIARDELQVHAHRWVLWWHNLTPSSDVTNEDMGKDPADL